VAEPRRGHRGLLAPGTQKFIPYISLDAVRSTYKFSISLIYFYFVNCDLLPPFQNIDNFDISRCIIFAMCLDIVYI
jgi:hypothetical protein